METQEKGQKESQQCISFTLELSRNFLNLNGIYNRDIHVDKG